MQELAGLFIANARRRLDKRTHQLTVMIPDLSLPPSGVHWTSPQSKTGLPGSPYPLGYSLLCIPFLALGSVVDGLIGGSADGYGTWAIRFFVLANVVFLTLGLVLLYRLLRSLGSRWSSDGELVARWSLISAVLLVPASLLGYYVFTVMSHTAGFFCTVLFITVWWSKKDSFEWWSWIWVGAAAGMMTLCRWHNSLFLLVPFIYGAMSHKGPIRVPRVNWWVCHLVLLGAFFLVLLPQFLQWKAIYGSFVVVPQGSDFISWPPARVFKVLFSSNNGLLFTTPALLVGVVGLFWAGLCDRYSSWPLIAAGASQVLVVGSLSAHWHGFAFGMRLLIEVLPVVAAGFLFFFLRAGWRLRCIALFWIVHGSLFTLLSAVKWRYEFIPRREQITFQEAFVDKLRLRTAYQRGQRIEAARQVGKDGDFRRAIAILEEARLCFGDSRLLLRSLVAAYRNAALYAEAEKIRDDLKEIESGLLY